MNPAKSATNYLALFAPASAGRPEKRRYRSKQERRRIVEESFAPGSSVARVARAHEVNANQIHAWRKLYQQGLLDDGNDAATLLPVRLSEKLSHASARRATAVRKQYAGEPCGAIEIEAGRARVRVAGAADPTTLRILLDCLLG
jgi:transposase